MGVQGSWAQVDGLRAHYLEAGSGDPLVLLHGGSWGERAEASWGTVIEDLAAAGRRVVAPDWLGFGGSALVRDFAAPEDRMLDHLAGLLTHLDVGRADVVALSMGGMLALRDQTGDHPRMSIRRLVLVSAGGPPMTPDLRKRIWGYDGSLAGMRDLLGLVYHDPAYAADDAVVQRWWAWSREPGVHEAFAAMAVRRPDAAPPDPLHLARVTVPTLVCAGAHDRLKPPGWHRGVADALPDARTLVFAASGHCPQTEEPKEFVAALLRFLSGKEPS